VCRLAGIGPGASGVVAKRCRRADGELQSFVHREILAKLPVESIRFYGFHEEDDGKNGWIFFEDGGMAHVATYGESFPTAFGRWLGVLHASASTLATRGPLPDRGPGCYLEFVRSSRLVIRENLLKTRLGDEDRSALEGLLVCFEVLEDNWSLIEERCGAIPWTLVHCDLQPKNILVRRTSGRVAFLPLDWEEAGWGPPAADLAGIDAASYWSAVRGMWRGVKFCGVEDQVLCGTLFKKLIAVHWETLRLASGSTEKAIRRLRIYAPAVSASIRALGFEG
jgi:hypothetical protein